MMTETYQVSLKLLFEKEFTTRLIEIGYQDGIARREEITRFLLESQPQSLDWEGF